MVAINSPNPAMADPRNFEGRSFFPIELRGGVDQESSKFGPPDGTLADAMNYHASVRGYERARGIWHYDGGLDFAPINMLIVTVEPAYYTLTGSGFTLGGRVTWGPTGGEQDAEAVVAYWNTSGTSPILGLVRIDGYYPSEGQIITDVETGTTWEFSASYPGYDISNLLQDAVNRDTSAALGDTQSTFNSFLDTARLAMVNQTGVYTISGSRNRYHGAVPGWGPINGGWQFNDEVYVTRNAHFFRADDINYPLNVGDDITVVFDDASTDSATILGWEYVTGLTTSHDMVIWLGPNASTTDYTTFGDSANPIASLKDGSTTIASASTPGGSDPITKSLVWKGTPRGWDFVHTGWTVPFVNGENAPNVLAAPLFQEDLINSSRNTGALPAITAQSLSNFYTGNTAWTNLTNIVSNNNSYTTCTLTNLSEADRTQALVVNFYDSMATPDELIPAADARVVGIEVSVFARDSGAGPDLAHEIDVRLVSMGGDATAGELTVSDNRSSLGFLTGTEAEYIYGSSTDMWGLDGLTAAEVNAGDVQLLLQYEGAFGSTNVIDIDYVTITFYYVPNNETAYYTPVHFAVGGTQGTIIAYQQFGGEFSIDTAYGEFTFSQLDNPFWVAANTLFTTEDFIGGLTIAYAQGIPQYNFLPGSVDMIAERAFYQTVEANFYENDATTAIYGVTGAGPAFTYSSAGFAFIKTPLDPEVDKPRHIAFHDNRLALGFKPGFVALSAIGVPNDFTGITGSDPSLWGTGDTLTGLLSLPGNVLAVFSESSIRTIEGSSESTGTMRVISANSGSEEYSAVLVGEPVFADNHGISSLSTTDKYGDFALGRLTAPIKEWVSRRVQASESLDTIDDGPAIAIPVRHKNQYRLFYNDGYILTLFFNDQGGVEPTFMHYKAGSALNNTYLPWWIDSTVLSTGRERIVMGLYDGHVYIVDGADANYVWNTVTESGQKLATQCWITTNPINMNNLSSLSKTFYAELQGRFFGSQTFYVGSDTNYNYDKTTNTSTYDTSVTVGASSEDPVLTARSYIVRPYLPTLTDGVSFKFVTTMDGTQPHTLQSLLLRSSSKGANRNRASKEY